MTLNPRIKFQGMKWEYRAIVLKVSDRGAPLTKALTEQGDQGWELIHCDLAENMFIFKRPKQFQMTEEMREDFRKHNTWAEGFGNDD